MRASESHYHVLSGFDPSFRFNSSGTTFVTIADDGSLKVWDTRSGKVCYSLRRHFSQISDFDLCFDDQHAASCCFGRELRVWRLGQTNWISLGAVTLPTHPTFLRFLPSLLCETYGQADDSIEPLPVSKYLLNTCEDGSIHLFDLAHFKPPEPPFVSRPSSQLFDRPLHLQEAMASNSSEDSSIEPFSFSPVQTAVNFSDPRLIYVIKMDVSAIISTLDIFRRAVFLRGCGACDRDGFVGSFDGFDNSSGDSPIPIHRLLSCVYVYFAMGLEVQDNDHSRLAETSNCQMPLSSLVVCRLTFRHSNISIGIQPPTVEHQLLYLPFSSISDASSSSPLKEPPDVAFALRSPRLLSASDSLSIYIWSFTNWDSVEPLCCNAAPLRLSTRIQQKLISGEYKVYQHPLARQQVSKTTSTGSAETSRLDCLTGQTAQSSLQSVEQFSTRVTALTWADR